MKPHESILATLLLWALCLPFGLLLCLLGLLAYIGHRAQFLAGYLFVRLMEATDPNQGGA